jgi:eukaryotic-like serine/threonine-protein kinase
MLQLQGVRTDSGGDDAIEERGVPAMHRDQLVQERYALEERIGRGGMAEVWSAHDRRLNRIVALKFLAPGFTDHPEFLVRLFDEARSVAAISHPHVIGVLDYGTSEDGPYLVMEYVPGGSLRDLTGEPMQPERAVEIMRQVAEGAGAAHLRGIVHRDIKPGNVLLSDDGTVKLADFGIASSDVGANLTATGAAIGSPHYISPEQAMGDPVTARADVYSLGVCLYELLTGVLPFDGDNPTAIAISHVEDVASSPSSLVADLDPRLDALIMRCLEKQPQARFENGNELAAALAGEDLAPYSTSVVSGEEVTSPHLASVAEGGPGVFGGGFWSWKRAAAAVIVVAAVIVTGIHLTSPPVVAETKRGAPAQHRPGSQSPPTQKSTSAPTAVPSASASPTPTPSPSAKSHRGPNHDSAGAQQEKPKKKPDPPPTPDPTTTSTTTTTTTSTTTTTTIPPSPTPAASPAGAPVPSPTA